MLLLAGRSMAEGWNRRVADGKKVGGSVGRRLRDQNGVVGGIGNVELMPASGEETGLLLLRK